MDVRFSSRPQILQTMVEIYCHDNPIYQPYQEILNLILFIYDFVFQDQPLAAELIKYSMNLANTDVTTFLEKFAGVQVTDVFHAPNLQDFLNKCALTIVQRTVFFEKMKRLYQLDSDKYKNPNYYVLVHKLIKDGLYQTHQFFNSPENPIIEDDFLDIH
jgi:hypothetical protein